MLYYVLSSIKKELRLFLFCLLGIFLCSEQTNKLKGGLIMIYLDDLKYMKLYKKPFLLPINKDDKKHGSAILLLTPNYDSSNNLMNHPLALNKPITTFQSYYVEKDIMYTINHESRNLEIAHTDYSTIINEQPSVFIETTNMKNYEESPRFLARRRFL